MSLETRDSGSLLLSVSALGSAHALRLELKRPFLLHPVTQPIITLCKKHMLDNEATFFLYHSQPGLIFQHISGATSAAYDPFFYSHLLIAVCVVL